MKSKHNYRIFRIDRGEIIKSRAFINECPTQTTLIVLCTIRYGTGIRKESRYMESVGREFP